MDRFELQAPHTLFQAPDIEIEQQAYRDSGVTQISAKLGEMNRQQGIDRLQFQKHLPIDHDVGPIAGSDQRAIELDPDGAFAFDTESVTG